VVRLARQANVPIVPVSVLGTDKVQPIDARVPRLHEVTFSFGPPIEVAGRTDCAAGIRAVTDEVMAEIQKLTGQEYVPRYAPERDAE
jgi:1-acyl-sn-glycerol-3-phosphate acyltransferase